MASSTVTINGPMTKRMHAAVSLANRQNDEVDASRIDKLDRHAKNKSKQKKNTHSEKTCILQRLEKGFH